MKDKDIHDRTNSDLKVTSTFPANDIYMFTLMFCSVLSHSLEIAVGHRYADWRTLVDYFGV